jgi:hypothetical protein
VATGNGQSVEIDPRFTALPVIDVQNDFRHADGSPAGFGFDVTPRADVVPRIADGPAFAEALTA